MHIIFGKENADTLVNKYTVLELDTFQIGAGPTITAFCAVENIPFTELTTLESAKTQHTHLLLNYRLKNWTDCLQGLDQLQGKWGGEMDSFYNELRVRVESFIKNPPSADWTPVIQK
jgi:hypothetical protein